jgi:cytochrome o ubiquinol oxidase subunit IV
VLAMLLTLAAFGLVWLRLLPGPALFYVVLSLGLAQMLVHFRCFLHIDLRRNARADLHLLLFPTLIILLMVGGTLVVVFNLQTRMM